MTLSPPSQLLLRNRILLAAQHLVIVDPADADIVPRLLAEAPDATVEAVHTQYAAFRSAHRRYGDGSRIRIRFGTPDECAPGKADLAVVYAGKGRAAHEMMLALTTTALASAGRLLWVGETRSGVRASASFLTSRFERVERIDTARRCALYLAEAPFASPAAPGALNAWSRIDHLRTPLGLIPVASLPGVFSQGRIDEGTELLLGALDDLAPTRILDFGCGCGVIGICCDMRWPHAYVEWVDASIVALAASRRTLQLHGLPTDRVFPSDVFSEVSGLYDLIISNPPFHNGIAVDYTVARQFIAQARQYLAPDGHLRIVANRRLPYRNWLANAFGKCTIVQETPRFRVWDALASRGRK